MIEMIIKVALYVAVWGLCAILAVGILDVLGL